MEKSGINASDFLRRLGKNEAVVPSEFIVKNEGSNKAFYHKQNTDYFHKGFKFVKLNDYFMKIVPVSSNHCEIPDVQKEGTKEEVIDKNFQ